MSQYNVESMRQFDQEKKRYLALGWLRRNVSERMGVGDVGVAAVAAVAGETTMQPMHNPQLRPGYEEIVHAGSASRIAPDDDSCTRRAPEGLRDRGGDTPQNVTVWGGRQAASTVPWRVHLRVRKQVCMGGRQATG